MPGLLGVNPYVKGLEPDEVAAQEERGGEQPDEVNQTAAVPENELTVIVRALEVLDIRNVYQTP